MTVPVEKPSVHKVYVCVHCDTMQVVGFHALCLTQDNPTSTDIHYCTWPCKPTQLRCETAGRLDVTLKYCMCRTCVVCALSCHLLLRNSFLTNMGSLPSWQQFGKDTWMQCVYSSTRYTHTPTPTRTHTLSSKFISII